MVKGASGRWWSGLAAVAAVVLVGGAGWLPLASAGSVEPTGATLPSARDAMAYAPAGGHAYFFGGWEEPGQGRIDQIVRYDPEADAVTVMAARLPSARHWSTAAGDGTTVHVFGGFDGQHRDQIIRYDPGDDTATVLAPRLPSARSVSAAVWTGDAFLVFGGNNGPGAFLDEVVRFDPATGAVQTMAAALPAGRDGVSAVFDGRHAYLFGGEGLAGASDDILRYDPATDTLEVLPASLPSARGRTAAVWDGASVWVYGGRTSTGPLDEVVRFIPATGEVSVAAARLPARSINLAAASIGGANYLFGGRQGDGPYLDDVLRHLPLRPEAPTGALAVAGPPGVINLTWQPPPGASADGVAAYRIYRAVGASPPALLAEVDAAVLRYEDRDVGELRTHYYRVSAVAPGGEGPRSVETCTAPAPAHLLPSLDRPCPVPAGWRELEVADAVVPVAAPLAPRVVEVHGAPRASDPRFYDVDLRVNGVALPTVHLFTDGSVGAPVDLVVPAPLRSAAVAVGAAVRSDPSQPVCLVGAGSLCPETLPFTLGNGWATSVGPKGELVVWVQPRVDGEAAPGVGVRVPFVGQPTALLDA